VSPRKLLTALVVALVAAAVGAASVLANQPDGPPAAETRYGPWAPGISAPVSALHSLPRTSHTPAAATHLIARAAAETGGDARLATGSARLLQRTTEVPGGGIYAYSPGDKAVCMLFWPRFGSCPRARQSDHPGMVFGFSPGGPGPSGTSRRS
jgi:hypothetical protein